MCDGLSFQRQKQVQKTERQNKRASKNKQQLVEKAIPNIADAIKTVVSQSENKDFRTKCLNLLKINDEKAFDNVLKKKLWKIASCRFNIKPAAESESQVVPKDGAKNREYSELPIKKNAVDEESGEDYFDDLAGDITFYNSDNCITIGRQANETTDASSEPDSSFELLAELYWDSDHLSDEMLPEIAQNSPKNYLQGHTGACDKALCVSASQEKSYECTVDPPKETQCPQQQSTEKCSLIKEVTDLTSPKAKLRCCKDASEPTEATTRSNDWLQEFSQDCYWVVHKNIPEQQEAKQSSTTENATLRASSEASLSCVSVSQTVRSEDDFDALAEFLVD